MISRLRLPVFAAIWVAGVAISMALGEAIYLVSCLLNKHHFYGYFMQRSLPNVIREDAIVRGITTGYRSGIIPALVFTLWAFWTTQARCNFWFGFKHALLTVRIVALFWLVGGINGLLAAYFFPMWLENILGWPAENLRWIWVESSVRGAYLGSIPSTVFACYKLRRNWHAQK